MVGPVTNLCSADTRAYDMKQRRVDDSVLFWVVNVKPVQPSTASSGCRFDARRRWKGELQKARMAVAVVVLGLILVPCLLFLLLVAVAANNPPSGPNSMIQKFSSNASCQYSQHSRLSDFEVLCGSPQLTRMSFELVPMAAGSKFRFGRRVKGNSEAERYQRPAGYKIKGRRTPQQVIPLQ